MRFLIFVNFILLIIFYHLLLLFTNQDWRAKDAALHLVLAVAVMTTSVTSGAGMLYVKL